jgi:hypothetical protein
VYSPLVEKAIALSMRAHAGQERKGQPGVPYVVHPLHVGMLLARHGFEHEIVAAGILHDVSRTATSAPRSSRATSRGRRRARGRGERGDGAPVGAAQAAHDRRDRRDEPRRARGDGRRQGPQPRRPRPPARRAGGRVWKLFRRGRGPTLDYYERVLDQLERTSSIRSPTRWGSWSRRSRRRAGRLADGRRAWGGRRREGARDVRSLGSFAEYRSSRSRPHASLPLPPREVTERRPANRLRRAKRPGTRSTSDPRGRAGDHRRPPADPREMLESSSVNRARDR